MAAPDPANAKTLPVPKRARRSTRELVTRLLREHVRPYTTTVVLAGILMVIGAALQGAIAWLLDPAIKYIFIDRREDMLLLIPAAVIAVTVVRAAASYGDALLLAKVGQRIVADLQKRMFASLVGSDLARLNAAHSATYVSSFLYDATLVRETVTKGITGFVKDALSIVFLVGVMFYQDWRLALIATLVLPAVSELVRKLGRRVKKTTKAGMVETGELSTVISETLDGRRIVKAYRLEDHAYEKAGASIDRRYGILMRGARARAGAIPIADALGGIGIAAVILYAGYQGIYGGMGINDFMSFIAALMLAFQPLRSLSSFYTVSAEGLAALDRIFAFVDVEPEIVERHGAHVLPKPTGRGGLTVRFRDVAFDYHEGAPALDSVAFEVKAGETVALVGPSGAGKSTIFNLLLRFYDVRGGAIEIAGHDIRDVTVASLRNAIGLVTQEPFLFDDTVRSNIAFGRPGAGDEEIADAARAAAAHDFIMALPKGYDTNVGEAGLKLSGGQRQRIAVARAMLKDAPIILLDEATSALDTESERQVQAALETLMKNRTTLVIAHRLSTVVHADRIVVLDRGRVVESGTHGELIARGGLYARLYRTQFADEAEPQRAGAAV